jgi:bifunctional non-homologous end joining protein LigD
VDSLDKYRAKRNFKITVEPKGSAHKATTTDSRTNANVKANAKHDATFVIQLHHASRLHYDFRLEINHTLKSWAIPKGPSLDPKDKRLAVHVEDHPLEYASFEGTIPAKQYGAGEVITWDRGTWRVQRDIGDAGNEGDAAAAYKAGKIKFELFGEKLHGHWTLVRTRLGQDQSVGVNTQRNENWLLIKERDDAARPAAQYDVTTALAGSVNKKSTADSPKATLTQKLPTVALPAKIQPQLATLAISAPSDDGWAYELKLDGYRILARIDADGQSHTFTRNGLDWSKKLSATINALADLGLRNCWLDGEIVVIAKDGRPSFQLLQNAFTSNQTQAIQYYLFDVLFADGRDTRAQPWETRRAILDALMAKNKSSLIGVTEIHQLPIKELLNSVCHHGLEGLIGKRRDAPYESGRSSSWIKLKCLQQQEFVIGGFTNPQGSRTGFGALLLGVYEQGRLRHVGRVGTGFDESRLAAMHQSLKALETKTMPFFNAPKIAGPNAIHWVNPTLVAQVSFAGWTSGGSIRHAVFIALRDDKPSRQINREIPKTISAVVSKVTSMNKQENVTTDSGVIVTHAHRVIDTSTGFTKLDVVRYYEQIAQRMLPHLINRPVAMVRVPENIQAEQFFQKHLSKYTIADALLLPDLDPGHAPLVALNTATALVSAAQMNVVEFHTWNSTAKTMDHPDRLIFDLDPDSALPWKKVVEAAKLTRTILQELRLISFLKTSGGNGFHVVVPLLRQHTWAASKEFAKAVSSHLAKTIPALFSAKMGTQNRIGKVFVDYLRNGRGSTTACAFSVRARPGLGVSMPISWQQLDGINASNEFNIVTAHAFLKKQKKDPWSEYEKSRQSIAHAIKAMAVLER